MKTNRKHNQIFRVTLIAIMTIALFSTTANAQRRANNDGNESRRIEQKTDQKATHYTKKSDRNKKNDSRNNAIDYRSYNDSRRHQVNRHNGNKKYYQKESTNYHGHNDSYKRNKSHHKGHKSDWYGNYYSTKWNHRYGRNDIHFKMRPDFHPHFDIRMNPIVFRRVPRKSVWVNIEGSNYVMYHGKFYHSSPFGFYRVNIPTYIKYLPVGCHEVWVNGHQFFRLNGVHFLSTPFGFKVIV